MEAEERHEHIEAYLAGRLGADAVAAFEQELSDDATLRKEVELHRKAGIVLQHGLRESRKQRLREIDATLATRLPAIILWRRLAAAASVLVLLAVGVNFYAHRTYSNTAIAQDLFAPVPVETYRGSSAEEALSTTALMIQAQDQFKNKSYSQAIETYLLVIKQDDLLKEQAEWNLLTCYLASDPTGAQFDVLLRHIVDDFQHVYHDKALGLQRTLDGSLYRLVN